MTETPKAAQEQPYTVSPQVREQLKKKQKRARQREAARVVSPRYWRGRFRALRRSMIRNGMLITHRRMFGVSHKSVQPGQKPVQNES